MTATAPSGRVRYAVVGLGHIAQAAVLPAFAHAENSQLGALVSDDAEKLRALSAAYPGVRTFSYADYERCLDAVDAVYIALPNSLHAEYTIRAARAGVHVLCEKPLAATAEDCEQMILACHEGGVRLMTAYRLHFEAITLEVLDLVRSGRIGEPKFFTSGFSMRVKAGDVRTKKDLGGGSVYDLGVYCINAARHVFGAEPKEVIGCVVNGAPDLLPEVDESTAAILRFEGERVATFVTSFNAADVGSYRIVGTDGDIHVQPAYEYALPLAYTLTVEDESFRREGEKTDQFAPEIVYFSSCLLEGREPEPSGHEGLQDVRIVQAIYESAETGKPIELPPYQPAARPAREQRITRPPVGDAPLVNTEAPHE